MHKTHNPLVCGGTLGAREWEPGPRPHGAGRVSSQDTMVQYNLPDGMGRASKGPGFKSQLHHQLHLGQVTSPSSTEKREW